MRNIKDNQCLHTCLSDEDTLFFFKQYLLKRTSCVCIFLEDSGDEMSSDSLGLDPHEEESSDEEVQMHRRLTRGRTREGKEGNPATSHSEDPFVPEDPHRGKDLQTDEQEQLSEASVVTCFHTSFFPSLLEEPYECLNDFFGQYK